MESIPAIIAIFVLFYVLIQLASLFIEAFIMLYKNRK